MPTNAYGLPYPADTATPDVPRDIEALAAAVGPRLPIEIASGSIAGPAGSTADTTAAITFPVGRFTAAPAVFVIGEGGTLIRFNLTISGTTTTSGATVRLFSSNATAYAPAGTIRWLAIRVP